MGKFDGCKDFIDRARIEPSRSDIWFAWFPVRIGALGTGPVVWLKKLWRNRCGGVTIYQLPEDGNIK